MSDIDELKSDDDESQLGAESPVPEVAHAGANFDVAMGVRVLPESCRAHININGSSGTQ